MARTDALNRLLVIDDDEDVAEFVKDVAEELEFDVAVANDHGQFRNCYDAFMPTIIVLDLSMPDMDGIEYLRVLGEKECRANVLLLSGFDSRVLKTAVRLGEDKGLVMSGALQKPIALEVLRGNLEALQRKASPVTVAGLETAVSAKELYLDYQPKIRLRNEDEKGTMISLSNGNWALDSCEALIRWRHPSQGIIRPDAFIPFAESHDMMVPLTDFVMEEMVSQLAAWSAEGFKPSIGFNVSPKSMTDIALPDRLAKMCDAANIEHNRVIAEITESAAMTDVQVSMDILTRLRLKGFRVAIDDFGTGYSSLVQLHRMPFTELKIDKSIIMELGIEEEAETITRSIIELAHNLGMEVCAEGVETEQCVEILRRLNCDILQGFYFSRPAESQSILTMSKGS